MILISESNNKIIKYFKTEITLSTLWLQVQLCIDHRLLESRTGRQSDAGHRRQHSAHDSPGRSRPRWKLTNVNCRRITAVRDALLSFSSPECDQICRLHRPVAQK